ncbi:MAG TPA: hypothetical protein VFJ51_00065 [Nitrososphaeraceae archaeon]|nr:hypothetical protein [Nitrososphaeraceae archaeon]
MNFQLQFFLVVTTLRNHRLHVPGLGLSSTLIGKIIACLQGAGVHLVVGTGAIITTGTYV